MPLGIFETLLLHHHRLPLGRLHGERFMQGLQALGAVPLFTWAETEARLLQLYGTLRTTSRIRIQYLIGQPDPLPVIEAVPFTYREAAGWTAAAYPHHCLRPLPPLGLKPLPYTPWAQAAAWAEEAGLDEALLLNTAGRLAEGSRTSLFLFRNGSWHTPPISEGPVAGVMRRHLMSLLREEGTPVTERPLDPDDLRSAEGAALTNALRGVIPLTVFEGKVLDPAPARRLQALIRPSFPGSAPPRKSGCAGSAD